jgi:2-polyprenyl-3-methyl-5-hydroxy-6-metoxy-1,4-benzoquinol methylase
MFPLRTEEILKWVNGPGVLDVGCTGHNVALESRGWLHGRLREAFPSVVGIDISAENIAALTRLGFSNLYVQSAETFELETHFDTIVAGELIEHLSNPGLFLQQARAHLKPTGRLVLTTPHPFCLLDLAYALLKFPKTCQNLQHTCWFCPQTMKELAKRSRLKVEHFELITDYSLDSRSKPYRTFVRLTHRLRFLLPRLFTQNAMLFVLAPDDAGPSNSGNGLAH